MLSSSDPALIEPVALRIAEAMRQMGGFVDIEDGTQIPGIEWELKVDRAQAATFGADLSLVASYVRMITNGMQLGEYRPDDRDRKRAVSGKSVAVRVDLGVLLQIK